MGLDRLQPPVINEGRVTVMIHCKHCSTIYTQIEYWSYFIDVYLLHYLVNGVTAFLLKAPTAAHLWLIYKPQYNVVRQ
jgi:hypothetical protein